MILNEKITGQDHRTLSASHHHQEGNIFVCMCWLDGRKQLP